MKTGPQTKYLYLFLFFFMIFSGCKKEVSDVDFRDKYTGDYDFITISYSWMLGGPYSYDTVLYSGKVYYEGGSVDTIMINNKENSTYKLVVDLEGVLYHSCGPDIGSFDSTGNLSLGYSSYTCGGGALGGGWSLSVNGTKN